MRLRNIFLFCLPILWASSALADFTTIELANEVRLSDFRAPQSANGVTSFKACGTCDLQVVNVTDDTRYMVNGQSVELSEFRRRLALVQDRDREMLIVRHHLEDDVITVISIRL
jgi:hypothetical protein